MKNNPLVSVIVPTYNSAAYLEGCLRSIKEQSYPAVELVVVDNKSTDDTPAIAKKYADEFFSRGPERSAQRNYGVLKSSGDYVLIIDSDMELTKDVVSECVEMIQADNAYKALVIPEESFGEGFWAQCKKLERSFYVGVDWMEGARFFDRKTFEEFGGYDEANTGTEDFDLPQRIEAKYGRQSIGRINNFIMHNEERLSLLKTCKKKLYYSQKLEVYSKIEANQSRYKKQSSPTQRYILFFSKPQLLFKNPVVGFGMLFMKTSEFGFGAAGYIKSKF